MHGCSFHNFNRACEVAHGVCCMLSPVKSESYLVPLDHFALLIGGLCSCLEHPGLGNEFQIQSYSDLALRYNDVSPLENHRAFCAFTILRNDTMNITSKLKRRVPIVSQNSSR